MENIIKLNSHDGSNNYLKKLNTEPYEGMQAYVLKTPYSSSIRMGTVKDGISFVDPPGGPMITTGEVLNDKYNIVKIVGVPYVGIIIVLENNDISSN